MSVNGPTIAKCWFCFKTTLYVQNCTNHFLPWKAACSQLGQNPEHMRWTQFQHASCVRTSGPNQQLRIHTDQPSSGSRIKQHAVFEGGNAHGESTDAPAAMGFKVLWADEGLHLPKGLVTMAWRSKISNRRNGIFAIQSVKKSNDKHQLTITIKRAWLIISSIYQSWFTAFIILGDRLSVITLW